MFFKNRLNFWLQLHPSEQLGSVLILYMHDSSVKRNYHISKVLNNIKLLCTVTSVAHVNREYYVINVNVTPIFYTPPS